MNFSGYIMSEDDAVARVIDNKIEPIIKNKMPLYLVNGGSFPEWLASRAIDRHRPNSRILKKMLRFTDTSDISTVLYAHAATITDNYWVKSESENLTYDEVSFKENYFADIALVGSARSFNRELTQKELSSNIPELTNIGSYEKCWKMENGSWYMYKQGNELERFSEIFISKITKQLGFPCAEYLPDDRFIKTKDFTKGKYNFEPMAALVGENEEYILNYDKLLEINEALAKQYLDIIFMDTLCFNMDRHTYNYGLLRDKNTGEIISMAPNFDNNIALISRGYATQAKNSANLLIELFGELLKDKNISYDLPAVSRDEVIKIAESSLPDESIDRNYVVDFVMDRYERIGQLIQTLDLRQGEDFEIKM
jgi:hypothetical protein